MKKISLIAAAMFAAVTSMPAAYADYTPNIYFNGYLRSGVFHGKGGSSYNFNKKKVGRLGNENDTYGEIALGSDVIKTDDTIWSVHSRLTISNTDKNRDYQDSQKVDEHEKAQVGCRELFVDAKGLLDWDKDASIWVGKRFYKREDIHITDMYYYDISGMGAGLENLGVGPGKLDLAWIRRDDKEDGYYTSTNEDVKKFVSVNTLDARYNFTVWDNANLELGETFYAVDRDNKDGSMKGDGGNANTFTIELNQGFNGGWNKVIYQWMHGSNANYFNYETPTWIDYTGASNSANGHRLINTGDITITDNFKLQHVEQYAYASGFDHNKADLDSKTNFSVVVRPFYQLTKMTRLIWEAGAYIDTQKKLDGSKDKQKGQKLTMAYALTPDASNMWSRPEIRFFVSYIHGTESIAGERQKVNLTKYTGDVDCNHNVMFGAQVEAWW